MQNYDVSGMLQTYSMKIALAKDTKQLKDIVKELKDEVKQIEVNKLYVNK